MAAIAAGLPQAASRMHGPSPTPVFSRLARLGAIVAWLGAAAIAAADRPETRGAATTFLARTWLIDDGLPNNVVNRMVQGPTGFLWVATSGGLARFDGREFREYPLPASSLDASASLRDVAVEDEATLALIPASGGVMRLRDGQFSEHPVSVALAGKVLLDLFVAPDGALWVATADSTVVRWFRGAATTFGPEDGIDRRRHSFSFATDEKQRVWIGAADYLGFFADGRLVRYPEPIGPSIHVAPARDGGIWISTDRLLHWREGTLTEICDRATWSAYPGLRQIMEDADGDVWLATSRNGLFRLHEGRVQPVGGAYDVVNMIMQDADENVWVATSGGGLTRLRPNVFTMLDRTTGMPDDITTAVCVDAAGTLWCANRSGGVVRVRDGCIEPLSRVIRGHPPFANTVCADHEGRIWVGAIQGVFRISNVAAPALESISAELSEVQVLHASRAGDVWVGSGQHRLGYFRAGSYRALSPAEGYHGHRVKAIAENSRGEIWIATIDRRVFEFVGGQLEPRITPETMPGGLIFSLTFDETGSLWIGTSRGLVRRREQGALDLFTTKHGLPDEQISQVVSDGAGHFWFGSQRGFFAVPRADLDAVARGDRGRVSVKTLGKDEGLIGASALTNMHPKNARGPDGTLWFTTHAGLVGIHPSAESPSRRPPRIQFDGMTVDGRAVPSAENLRVSAGSRQIEFRFAALNFAAPEKVRMRHRLDGFDPDWNDASDARTAVYGRLAPGAYTLRASAGNQDGVWSDNEATIAFVVVPEWWQTWWARGGALLGFTALVVWAARGWSHRRLRVRLDRLEREHALEKERARIARDLHDELGGSLTQIGLLADRLRRNWGQPDTPEELSDITQRMRQLTRELDSMVWTISPKNDRWNALARFVGRYAQRYFREASVDCAIDGVEQIPDVALAPEVQHQLLAVVKETLNNILKHARAQRVTLAWSYRDGRVGLRIRDDGGGFDPGAQEHSERNGLNNMRSRMAEIHGEIQISSRPDAGTEVVLLIAIDPKSPPREATAHPVASLSS